MDTQEHLPNGVESAGSPVDQRGLLAEEPFDYRVSKDQRVLISWRGQQVMVLKGAEARKLLARLAGLDPQGVQLALAKVTGNFKRGNERRAPRL